MNRKFEYGDVDVMMRQITNTPLLTENEEFDLGMRKMGGDRSAFDELCRRNLRLVVNIAKSFLGRGLSLGDLIQEGSIAVMGAAEEYDPRIGRFSTLATPWIRNAFLTVTGRHKDIVPIQKGMKRFHKQYKLLVAELHDQLRRSPTDEEIAARLYVTVQTMHSRLSKLVEIIPIDDEVPERAESAGVAMEEEIEQHSRELQRAGELQRMHESLSVLDVREQEVIRKRFGLDGPKRTLKDVGEELGVTRERVRQIEAEAKEKLLQEMNMTPEELKERSEKQQRLLDSLSRLDEREKEVLSARMGLGREEESSRSIGKRLGLSRTAVETIERRALKKIGARDTEQKEHAA